MIFFRTLKCHGVLAGGFVLAAGGAALACPTEMGKGLSLTYASGATAVITPGPEAGQVIVRTRYTGAIDEGDIITSWHGVYDLHYVEFGPDVGPDPYSETLTYPNGMPPLPVPGMEDVSVQAELQTADGPSRESNIVRTGALERVTLGGCEFDGFSLTSTVVGEGEPVSDGVTWNFVFVPALGMAIQQQGDGDVDEVTSIAARTP
jgi:hypothetical protein